MTLPKQHSSWWEMSWQGKSEWSRCQRAKTKVCFRRRLVGLRIRLVTRSKLRNGKEVRTNRVSRLHSKTILWGVQETQVGAEVRESGRRSARFQSKIGKKSTWAQMLQIVNFKRKWIGLSRRKINHCMLSRKQVDRRHNRLAGCRWRSLYRNSNLIKRKYRRQEVPRAWIISYQELQENRKTKCLNQLLENSGKQAISPDATETNNL